MVDPFESGAINGIQPETVLYSTIKTLPDRANPSVIRALYLDQGLSINLVAELVGASKSSDLASLQRFKIPARARHQRHGRPGNPPFGYHYVAGKLVDHPREKKVVQTVKKMFVEKKLSMSDIAKSLTRDGIPTKHRKAAWRHEMMRSIPQRNDLRHRPGRRPNHDSPRKADPPRPSYPGSHHDADIRESVHKK